MARSPRRTMPVQRAPRCHVRSVGTGTGEEPVSCGRHVNLVCGSELVKGSASGEIGSGPQCGRRRRGAAADAARVQRYGVGVGINSFFVGVQSVRARPILAFRSPNWSLTTARALLFGRQLIL